MKRIMTMALLATLLATITRVDHHSASAGENKMDTLRVYIGTYTTHTKSAGIYRFDLDLATGKATPAVVAAKTKDPSFLAIHPTHRFLYAVGEVGEFNGKKTGAVSAFSIDPKTGDLTLLNQESSGGSGPCHIIVDKAGKHALAANYGGGSVCVLPIGPDGKLAPPSCVVQHEGSSVDKARQEAPHAHSINLDPTNRFAFVADLGLDKVMIYRFDSAKGILTANDPPAAKVAPGSGPRHFAFHPSGKYAYVINEMALTITAFSYDPEKGVLTTLQTISTVPEPRGQGWSTAEVVVHPSGKFVYGSNRGQNSIAIFAVDQDTGKLTARGRQSHHIKTPRNFAVDPTGAYLLAANQDGASVVIFRINPETGALTPTGTEVEVPNPVCVRFNSKSR